jgi:alkylresorcinol/alkylpyrone synthase
LRIAAVAEALPAHRHPQEELAAALEATWPDRPALRRRLRSLHSAVGVEARHLALPMEAYHELTSFGQFNDAWIEAARELGAEAIRSALAQAGLDVADVGALFFVSVTGVASPSIDAQLVNRLGLRPDVRRVPIFGLGCVAGAAGLARAADFVKAWPEEVAVLLWVELCSLTLQRDDHSVANLISTGLFGDGAAAVVVAGAAREVNGPRVVATRSTFYPGTEHVMGWAISEEGLKIVLSPEVPRVVRENLPRDVDSFLAAQGLCRDDVACWIGHPGGPKVLEAVQEGLGLTREQLAPAWECLRRVGNLSSTSVLLVLQDVLRRHAPEPGGHGLLFAMGPGFCSELVLLRW